MIKICGSCHQEKEETEFNYKNKSLGILQTVCKICTREQSKRYYQKNTQAHKDRAKKSKKGKRTKFKQLKQSLSCILCGESDSVCLEFHHTDPNTKEGNVSYMADVVSWARVEQELNKCVCLCSNCHKKVHAGHLTLQ